MQIFKVTSERMVRWTVSQSPQQATTEGRISEGKLREETFNMAQLRLRINLVARKQCMESWPEKSVQEHVVHIFICNLVRMPSP